MNLELNISKVSDIDIVFELKFKNDTSAVTNLPVTAIRNSVDRIGLIFMNNGIPIEPADTTIYTLKDQTKDDVSLQPGQEHTIKINGKLELFQDKYWSVVFQNASYLINPETIYNIYIHWDKFKSNPITWSFSVPS